MLNLACQEGCLPAYCNSESPSNHRPILSNRVDGGVACFCARSGKKKCRWQHFTIDHTGPRLYTSAFIHSLLKNKPTLHLPNVACNNQATFPIFPPDSSLSHIPTDSPSLLRSISTAGGEGPVLRISRTFIHSQSCQTARFRHAC